MFAFVPSHTLELVLRTWQNLCAAPLICCDGVSQDKDSIKHFTPESPKASIEQATEGDGRTFVEIATNNEPMNMTVTKGLHQLTSSRLGADIQEPLTTTSSHSASQVGPFLFQTSNIALPRTQRLQFVQQYVPSTLPCCALCFHQAGQAKGIQHHTAQYLPRSHARLRAPYPHNYVRLLVRLMSDFLHPPRSPPQLASRSS